MARRDPMYLERRSAVAKRVQALDREVRVLVVEDNNVDATKIQTGLKMMFGAGILTTHISEPADITRTLRSRRPDVVVLDDRMADGSGAEGTLPQLRQAGFRGPVILISGFLSQAREAALARLAGISAIINKDDADSLVLAEAILAGIVGSGRR
jgi:DNA-binding NarL/FixJ family response regulator